MYLKVENLNKSYGKAASYVRVLKDISFEVKKGELCAILGASGSGKSTLLNIIGGIDTGDSGYIEVEGLEITSLNAKELTEYRRNKLGFIFQFYNLVPNLTVGENIGVCSNLSDSPMNMDELLKDLDMLEHVDKMPFQLSGGQQQRCAIARALIKKPGLLLCDEPTGALDSKSAHDFLILLEKVNKLYGTTIILVTHDERIKNAVDHVIGIRDGEIILNEVNAQKLSVSQLKW